MPTTTAKSSQSDDAVRRAQRDKTPPLAEQAEDNGWTAGVFNFGKAENDSAHYFNPSLVERPSANGDSASELWLIVRRAEFKNQLDKFGMNACWAFSLRESVEESDVASSEVGRYSLTPEFGVRLKFPMQSGIEQFEDPRAIFFNGRTFVGACNFIWYENGEWTGAHQVLGVFRSAPGDETNDWSCEKMFRPEIGGNSLNVDEKGIKHEKNWLWFVHEGRIHLLYYSKPWRVAAFGKSLADVIPYESEGATWRYGEIRGGTPPVLGPAPSSLLAEGEPGAASRCYWTFFHSSMPWVDRFRRYYMGAIAFESKPPFAPVYITPEPLLIASQNDYWQPRKPLVVFPGGALLRPSVKGQSGSDWLVVYGINDLKSGYVQIPHADLLKRVKPIRDLDKINIFESGNQETRKEGDATRTNALAVPAVNTEPTNDSAPHLVSNGTEKVQPSSVPTLGDQIRQHCDALLEIENNQASRKMRILTELRKRKLVPQARPNP